MPSSHGTVDTYDADLYVLPTVKEDESPKLITIGDIHGNALKLFHFLIAHGIVKATEDQYDEFKTIYCKKEPTQEDVTNFKKLIDKLEINTNLPYIRILGDELADRGMNDFYTL